MIFFIIKLHSRNYIFKHTKIFALSSENLSKYEFLTSKDVLPEEDLIKKDATKTRFEYFALGKELEE